MKHEQPPSHNCPECQSENVTLEMYDIGKKEFTFYCHSCHYQWTRKLNKLLTSESKFDISKVKEERLCFNHLGKIKDSDITEILLDLFEVGGYKFYKKTKRYRRKK